MKKAVILGKRKAGIIEVADPKPVKDWALVKVHAAPMCAEYKSFLAGDACEYLGHEAAGEVVAIDGPSSVEVGRRVVVMPGFPCGVCALCLAGDYIHCENCIDFENFTGSPEGSATMAQYLLKPSRLLMEIPPDVSYEHASLACCCLGPSFGAFESMNVNAFDIVLITGVGPVGLGAIVNARFRNARVLVVEGNRARSDRAKALGAEEVLDPRDESLIQTIRRLTGGAGVDKALDCSGVVAAQRTCIDATRRKGHVAFVGECYDDTLVKVSDDLIRKGLTIHGSWHYNIEMYPRVMQVIQNSPLINQLISNSFTFDQIQEAFETSASCDGAKIILKPWE